MCIHKTGFLFMCSHICEWRYNELAVYKDVGFILFSGSVQTLGSVVVSKPSKRLIDLVRVVQQRAQT